ncbi:DUF1559 domain-containing protein [Neorhodopirellula lusitana]|nr:DUF1559 domain-containing protein [Neorhodopirellula lusitana]
MKSVSPMCSAPMYRMPPAPIRRAFSLLEIAVVLVILFVLFAISVPIVRDMRSIARRSNCHQNLARIVLANQAYASDFGHLPSGTFSYNAKLNEPVEPVVSLPDRDEPSWAYHQNWLASLLPFVDREGLYQSIDFRFGVYEEANRLPREVDLSFLRCPASSQRQVPNTTSYVGMHSNQSGPILVDGNGLLMLNRWVLLDEVVDGMAHTILVGEKLSPPEFDLGWMSGTRSSLRNAGTPINAEVPIEKYKDPLFVGGLASLHAGGASVAMGDGAVSFLSETVDMGIYQKLVGRNDSTTLPVGGIANEVIGESPAVQDDAQPDSESDSDPASGSDEVQPDRGS